MSVSSYSTTPSSNATISGTNIAEGCAAGNMNDAVRQLMADIRAELTDAVLSITAKATVADIRTALGVLASTNASTALSGLTPAADQLPYFTGGSAASLTTLSSFMRTLLDDADAATARGTLGIVNVTSSSLISNGGFRVYSDGFKETWGYVTIGANSAGSYTVPAGASHSSWIIPSLSMTVQNGNAGQSENIGIADTWVPTQLTSIPLYNAENFSRTVYIQTKGV